MIKTWKREIKIGGYNQVVSAKACRTSQFPSHLVQRFSTVHFRARQALPLRDHLEENGNYLQLLKLLGDENGMLSLWLDQTTNFTSHDCQNEMLGILRQAVVRSIISTVKTESRQFMVDGTQDCAKLKQESIC